MQRILFGNNWWHRFLPLAFMLAGAGITVIGIAADLLDFGGPRGIGPRQVSLALSGFAVFLAGVDLISTGRQRYIIEWLMVALATITVVFAADLLVINGLPDIAAKHLAVASLGFSILSMGTIPVLLGDQRNISAGLNLFSLEKLEVGKFLSIALQLGLLVLVIRLFRLENQAIYHNLMLLTFYGFLIHYLLPSHHRLPFFLFISLAAVAGILGFINSIRLIGIGLGLIGICHLPISYNKRVAVLFLAGAAMAAVRTGWIQLSGLDVIWPILASM
ncbi:MAG TPA: hypothetical protein VFQ23_00975, partial [Anaerolineales bacterium]|nr:hypothetical protein [Anaerolineales bacterium]